MFIVNALSKNQLRRARGTSKDSGKCNIKDIFFDFVVEVYLARINCEGLFCARENETWVS
jgi:hypothetical protein